MPADWERVLPAICIWLGFVAVMIANLWCPRPRYAAVALEDT